MMYHSEVNKIEQKIDYPYMPDMKIIFGDWCFATLKGVKVDKPRAKIIFVFIPDPYMRWVHQIPNSDYDESLGLIKKEYPEEYCKCVVYDPMSLTWFLMCDYHGRKCDTALEINQELIVKCKMYKEERDAWQKAATIIPLKLKRAIIHPEEYKTEMLKEMKEQKKIIGSDYGIGGEEVKGG